MSSANGAGTLGVNFDTFDFARFFAGTQAADGHARIVLHPVPSTGEELVLGGYFDYDADGHLTGGTVSAIDYNGVDFTFHFGVTKDISEVLPLAEGPPNSETLSIMLSGDNGIGGSLLDDLLRGYGGNDYLGAAAGNDTVFGGSGNDVLTGGLGDDVLYGDDQNDKLNGDEGADDLDGSAGADTLSGDDGADTIHGGTGRDSLTGGAGADIFTFAAGDSGVGIGAIDFILDWTPSDHLAFTVGALAASRYTEGTATDYASALSLADYLIGRGDADVVAMKIGSDVAVFVDSNQDDGGADDAVALVGAGLGDISAANFVTVDGVYVPPPAPPSTPTPTPTPTPSSPAAPNLGTSGDDELTADAGATEIHAGDGDDTITGGAEPTYLRGDAGDDRIIGGTGFDDINGNMGDDTAFGGLGDDWVVGGKDQDFLSGDAGADIVYGNRGADTCNGGEGADTVRGGKDDDVVNGGEGDDWLSGDLGVDVLTGGAGADTFHTFAGAGLDTVTDFNRAEGDRIQLASGTAYSVIQTDAGAEIDLGGGDGLVLTGVDASAVASDWFVFV